MVVLDRFFFHLRDRKVVPSRVTQVVSYTVTTEREFAWAGSAQVVL